MQHSYTIAHYPLLIFCHENGMEELHQNSYLKAKQSDLISVLAQPVLPQQPVLGGTSWPATFLTVAFEILLVFKSYLVFFSWKWHGRSMALFHQYSHFLARMRNEWSLLCIASAELAIPTWRNLAASLLIEFEIVLVFKSHFVFLFVWSWHEKSVASTPPIFTLWWGGGASRIILVLAQLSLVQPVLVEGTSWPPPWLSHSGSCWLSKGKFDLVLHEASMMEEEWPAFHQYSHLKARTSGPILLWAKRSLVGPTVITSSIVASLVVEFKSCWGIREAAKRSKIDDREWVISWLVEKDYQRVNVKRGEEWNKSPHQQF